MGNRGIPIWPVVIATALFFGVMLLAGLGVAALAAGAPSCTNVGPNTTICQSPGNAQITTSPGTIATPNWGWPFWGGGLIISIG
ncbi:hypothetical protein [Mycobacterium sp. shizuoka-1]|uniref:hypothetical protein n=1 Tax=Mycobacterium sp. shizuoka-1 TaxID=2039281 RepID=UPI000C063291|nr:hypothetical protein [Mycobacterium sp. shizuoka-1]GAY13444.1 hypothetical protein MSZK_01700 [Mycobacterium sp. shizuoka-1]